MAIMEIDQKNCYSTQFEHLQAPSYPPIHPKEIGWSASDYIFESDEIPIGLDLMRRKGEVVAVDEMNLNQGTEIRFLLNRNEACEE